MTVNLETHNLIHYHRKAAGLNRKQLAELAGVGKTVIYDLEKGKTTVRWSTLLSVLNALNISITFDSPLMQQYEESNSESPQ